MGVNETRERPEVLKYDGAEEPGISYAPTNPTGLPLSGDTRLKDHSITSLTVCSQ